MQQINGEAQGKCIEGSAATPDLNTTASHDNQGMLVNVSQPNHKLKVAT
jgi:hypothetical protein